MKRKGIHKPTIEDLVEISGIETLHPGGFALTKRTAGMKKIGTELEEWSKPEMYWKVRKNRNVPHYSKIMSLAEKLLTVYRIMLVYGIMGVLKAFQNEKYFYSAVIDGKLGYCLFKGIKQ